MEEKSRNTEAEIKVLSKKDLVGESNPFSDDVLGVVEHELFNTIRLIDQEIESLNQIIESANKISPGLHSVKSELIGHRIDALKKIGDFVFNKKKLEDQQSLEDVQDITQLLLGVKGK